MKGRTLLAATAMLMAGCAQLQVFKDEALSVETGFRFYVGKPYLLVGFTNNPAGAIDVSVVHIPDVANPYYARPKPGLLGNSNLSMTIENGVLKTFGQEVNSNVTGLLDSVGGLRKALAEAGKIDREARGAAAAAGAGAAADAAKQARTSYDGEIARLDLIASGMRRYAQQPGPLTPLESANVANLAVLVESARTGLREPRNAPSVVGLLDQVLRAWDAQVAPPLGPTDTVRQNLDESKRQLADVVADLVPAGPVPPPFLLYEIVARGGVTTLKQVK